MIGITLTTDQIRNAPPDVRRWIEHEVIASLGLAATRPPAPALPEQSAHLVGLQCRGRRRRAGANSGRAAGGERILLNSPGPASRSGSLR